MSETVSVLKKKWTLQFCPSEEMGRKAGCCDHPNSSKKAISIWDQLEGVECADTILHEMLHCAGFEIFDEHFIETLGTDMARALFKRSVLERILKEPIAMEVARELIAKADGNEKRPGGLARSPEEVGQSL